LRPCRFFEHKHIHILADKTAEMLDPARRVDDVMRDFLPA
jgi:hypothetical protein